MIQRFILVPLFILMASLELFGQHTNPIVFGNNRITLITPTLFRLEYAENGAFIDTPTMFAFNKSYENLLQDFTVQRLGEHRYEIKTSALRIVYYNDGFPFGMCNLQAYYQMNGKECKFTNRNIQKGNLGGSISTLDRVNGPIPLQDGLLSRDGWYIVDDGGTELLVNDWLTPRPSTHVQDLYCFVYGKDYRAALASLGAVSGHVPMTRKYMHGVWYCRYWDYTFQDYINLLNEYKKNDFPLDNMVFDMGWHTQKEATVGTGHASKIGWTGYTWNTDLIPDPENLIRTFHENHVTVSLNDHPHDGIRPHESMYKDFMHSMGASEEDTENGKTILFNLGDSIYMKNFFKYAHGGSENMGIDFWWLDWQQNYLYNFVRGTHTSSLSWINKLYFDSSKNTGKRGVGYSRWSGFGDHRYPIQFSGDAVASWDMLGFEVKLTVSSGNAGCYYWAHDIGGFYGGTDPELYARWTQFGALSAALRVHSAMDAKLDRRPWLWGNMALESMKKAYHFRSCLMPYIYSCVWQTHQTMIPLNRGMYIDYANDEHAYLTSHQFMFGDLLLAAPIISAGKGEQKIASRKVWFPGNDLWYDYFSGQCHRGGTEANVEKTIDEFPLFVKGGYLLPMQLYTPRPASEPLDTLVLRVYPGKDMCNNTYTLYEDDGISGKYEHGEYALTDLNYKQSVEKVTITISSTRGEFEGQLRERSYIIEFPANTIIGWVKINSRKSVVYHETGSGMQRIFISKQSIRKDVVVSFLMK